MSLASPSLHCPDTAIVTKLCKASCDQLLRDASKLPGISSCGRQRECGRGACTIWAGREVAGSTAVSQDIATRHFSTKQDVLSNRLALEEVLCTELALVGERQVQKLKKKVGCNRVAIANCRHIMGNHCAGRCQELHKLAWPNDVWLSFVWRPRLLPDNELADV
jgi:hypothetical protein